MLIVVYRGCGFEEEYTLPRRAHLLIFSILAWMYGCFIKWKRKWPFLYENYISTSFHFNFKCIFVNFPSHPMDSLFIIPLLLSFVFSKNSSGSLTSSFYCIPFFFRARFIYHDTWDGEIGIRLREGTGTGAILMTDEEIDVCSRFLY